MKYNQIKRSPNILKKQISEMNCFKTYNKRQIDLDSYLIDHQYNQDPIYEELDSLQLIYENANLDSNSEQGVSVKQGEINFNSNNQQELSSIQNNGEQSLRSSDQTLNSTSQSENQSYQRKERKHLTKKRKRGDKNKIQKQVNGYWSKNFLQFGKTYHFQYIMKIKGKKFMNGNQQLKKMMNRKGMTLEDYENLYKMPQIENIWRQFFDKKILFRALMLSRTKDMFKVIYSHFMDTYEKAYKMKKFEGLNAILDEKESMVMEQQRQMERITNEHNC